MKNFTAAIVLVLSVFLVSSSAWAHNGNRRGHDNHRVKDRSYHHSHKKDGDYIKYGYKVIHDILHLDCDHHRQERARYHHRSYKSKKVCKVVYRGHGHHSRYKEVCYRR